VTAGSVKLPFEVEPEQAVGNATPRALLLDFGSVISVSAFERHRQTERQLNLSSCSLTWLGPLDPGTDPLWV
jgi:putative hydrolase of the HAD superfamily